MIDVLEVLRSGDSSALAILREHEVIRGFTDKDIEGDYAEYLVKEHYGGRLMPQRHRGYDVEADGVGRVSVKSRSLAVDYYRHMSVAIADEPDFDRLVLIEFADDWTVATAREMRWDEA